jgi:hypothetical protein
MKIQDLPAPVLAQILIWSGVEPIVLVRLENYSRGVRDALDYADVWRVCYATHFSVGPASLFKISSSFFWTHSH